MGRFSFQLVTSIIKKREKKKGIVIGYNIIKKNRLILQAQLDEHSIRKVSI